MTNSSKLSRGSVGCGWMNSKDFLHDVLRSLSEDYYSPYPECNIYLWSLEEEVYNLIESNRLSKARRRLLFYILGKGL